MRQFDENDPSELEDIEISLLLEGIYLHYGYDFRNYSRPSIARRIRHRMQAERIQTATGLLDRILRDRGMMDRLIGDFSINVTEMFRDPAFFLEFRRKVVPRLHEWPSIRIWHAGCSTGEEVYSMAILLQEEGLHSRTMLYATDMNEHVLEKASAGMVPLDKMKLYTRNYLQSGGKKSFSEYYTVIRNHVMFHPALFKNIAFSQHNLVTDHSFNDFNVIICRNVLIYFNEPLQQRVFRLFMKSLIPSGFLGLGSKEGIPAVLRDAPFKEIDREHRIYIKNGQLGESNA